MKYTIILRRSAHLMEVMDDYDTEFYVSNADVDYPEMSMAVHAARIEAATADRVEYVHCLRQQGINVVGSVNILSENYEVVMLFEGIHKPMFGWEPELSMYQF